MNQPTKRKNPFDVPKVVEPEEPKFDDNFTEVTERNVSPQRSAMTENSRQNNYVSDNYHEEQRVVRRTYRQPAYTEVEEKKEKFTSTMNSELRRKIKIVCATRGIMFAQFVEDACKEKLAREGVK